MGSRRICGAEFKSGYPPDWPDQAFHADVELDREVVNFPRRDGNPPGHNAPEYLRVADVPPPPLRPTDGARFFRWEDQAAALDQAQEVHARTKQHKVWVEFPHVIGEGYLIGGEEYRTTAFPCVRLRDGVPVDSWPDLRRGATP